MAASQHTGTSGASTKNRRTSSSTTTHLGRRVSDRLANRVADTAGIDRLSDRVEAWRGLHSSRRGR